MSWSRAAISLSELGVRLSLLLLLARAATELWGCRCLLLLLKGPAGEGSPHRLRAWPGQGRPVCAAWIGKRDLQALWTAYIRRLLRCEQHRCIARSVL